MKKRYFPVLIFFLNTLYLFSFSKEVESVLSLIKDKDLAGALEYLESQIDSSQAVHDKRDLLIFTASLQESSGFYELAGKTYEKAASLNSSEGSESSVSLLVNAARCALSSGNSQLADMYLATVARKAVSPELAAKIKLYAVWSWLSKITDEASLHEPLVILNSYVDMKGMETVQAGILLTLWYLSGDASYSSKLMANFPDSMETSIVLGRAQLMPTPFWYFVPRKASASVFEPESLELKTSNISAEAGGDLSSLQKNEQKNLEKTDEGSTTIIHYQLGFFRNKENAQDLMLRLQKAGFSPSVEEETRQSGTTYHIVIVKESASSDMGARLKNAGFECYPVYK